MDVIEKLERDNPNLNWADWMDALQKEAFEKSVMSWTRRRVAVSVVDLDQNRPPGTDQVPEPA